MAEKRKGTAAKSTNAIETYIHHCLTEQNKYKVERNNWTAEKDQISTLYLFNSRMRGSAIRKKINTDNDGLEERGENK